MSIRERSGSINSKDRLVTFLYLLLRDHLSAGTVEEIMKQLSSDESCFCNGWTAQHAMDIAERLKNEAEKDHCEELR